MKKLIIVSLALFLSLTSSYATASSRYLSFGIQYGPTIVADWQVQGPNSTDLSPIPLGVGNGSEILGFISYTLSPLEMRIEMGKRTHDKNMSDNYPASSTYSSNLKITQLAISLIYRLQLHDLQASPYWGFGGGIYKSKWNQDSYTEWDSRYQASEGSETPLGIHALAGFDYALIGKLFLGIEIRYSYITKDWNIVNAYGQDRSYIRQQKINDINIGGTSFRFGIMYQFNSTSKKFRL